MFVVGETPRHVFVSDKPLGLGGVRHFELLPSMTVQQIVDFIPDKPKHFDELGCVIVNDVKWPRSCWHFAPEPGASVILGFELQGGNRVVKSVLAIVATIALTIATAGIATAGAAGLLGSAFAAGTLGAKILAAGIGLLGSVAIGALFKQSPTPQQVAQDTGAVPGAASYSGNILPQAGRLPRIMNRRCYPPVVVLPYHEIDGNDEIVRAGFMLAGSHELSNARIGDTLIDATSAPDVRYESRPGVPGDEPITILTNQAFESAPQINLIGHEWDTSDAANGTLMNQEDPWSVLPKWARVTTRAAPDEFWITLLWPEGLFFEADTTIQRSQSVRIRFREVGDTNWINVPEIQYASSRVAPFKQMIKFNWTATPLGDVNSGGIATNEGAIHCYTDVPASNLSPNTGGWTADSYFDPGDPIYDTQNIEFFQDHIRIDLDTATYPKGRYEFEIIKSRAYSTANLAIATYIYGGGSDIYDFFGFWNDGGTYKGGITGFDGVHEQLTVLRICSIWNEDPFPLLGEDSIFALEATNRNISDFSVEAQALVPDWDGSSWGPRVPTTNPAAHLRDILTGPFTARPLPDDLIDDIALLAWRSQNTSESLELHDIAEGSSVEDAVTSCVAAGRAVLRSSDTWGVAYEHDRTAETPVQIFSERNSNNYRWAIAWDDLPDALLVSYLDDLNEEQQILVLDEGVTIPKRKADVRYSWIDNQTQAVEQAQLDMKLARLRQSITSIDVDAEGLVCQRGDLIGIQHDTLSAHAGRARIKEVVKSGDDITGLILDTQIPVVNDGRSFNEIVNVSNELNVNEVGMITSVAIRTSTSSLLVKQLAGTTVETNEIEFQTPFTDPGIILHGDVVVSGPTDSEYRRMIVFGIQMSRDLTMTLSLLNEAAEIYA